MHFQLLSRVWLCNSMDYNPSGFSVHGIFQVRILEWVAISSSKYHDKSAIDSFVKPENFYLES